MFIENIHKLIRYITFGIIAFMFIFAVVAPIRAHGQLFEASCWFGCGDYYDSYDYSYDYYDNYGYYYDEPFTTYNYYSYDVPSGYNYYSYYNEQPIYTYDEYVGHNYYSYHTEPVVYHEYHPVYYDVPSGYNYNYNYNNNNAPQVQNPTVSIYASPSNVSYNGSSTISWSSSNATSCSASGGTNGWSGNRNTSGTFYTGALTNGLVFYITCSNSVGSANNSVTVSVDSYIPPYVQPYQYNQVSVTTNNATNVTTTSATLNGYINGNGLYSTAWFTYGTNTNFGYTTTQSSYNSGFSNYSAVISGLIPNTTYYFRAVAQSSQGIVYGNILSFNTGTNYASTSQPTVVIYTDQVNITSGTAVNVRWISTNATSCVASGGSAGWAGAKNVGSGVFNTGALTSNNTYTITCSNSVGSASDSETVSIREQQTTNNTVTSSTKTSLVLINSSVDRNQPIVPTLDNTKPHPGDEINYTVNYQNIGTGAITSLVLQMTLPEEVSYLFSSENNPSIFGNTLVFNLGTLKANSNGTVTVRVLVRNNIPTGTNLNFPATLSYINPSGQSQTVSANVSAQVWNGPVSAVVENVASLGANVFGAGFLPTNLFGWLLLIILILLLVLIIRYILNPEGPARPIHKK